MLARRLGPAWEVLAPAKLNLYLEILGKRDDGFHELETLMTPVCLYDQLRWTPLTHASDFEFRCRRSQIRNRPARDSAPNDATNLAAKAAILLAHEAGIRPHGKLVLWKRIPTEAGLGGGSSDAAAALRLLNTAWGVNYSNQRLLQLAANLGSDVPFFLIGGFAIGRGRGELVQALPGMPRLHAVAVKPATGVATAQAFAELKAGPVGDAIRSQSRRRLIELINRLRGGAIGAASRFVGNRLQSTAQRLNPWIERIERAFSDAACPAHAMTGSGSAYFGLLPSARRALHFARTISAQRLGAVYVVPTCR